MEIAILAAGCFWGPEIKFGKLNGVLKTEVGYCGGDNPNTSYKEVCTGKTNHAEVVKIEFNEEIISYEDLINYFFEIHDPTTLNQQGYDIGTQYRSEIFYTSEKQKKIAEDILKKNNIKFNGKIVTNISENKNYCKAEDYHQKYLER
tara:strand:+ start:638 stop:1078 length:441 start_codon:yes stop_codon:yes gene_type:complete